MYMGDRFEAKPIATPPQIRQARNVAKELTDPVPIELTVNSKAAAISSRFRPNRSLKIPEVTAPNRQPMRALLMAQPTSTGVTRWKNFS